MTRQAPITKGLPLNHFGAILVDAPWKFARYSDKGQGRSPQDKYRTMKDDEIAALPILKHAADNCVLFFWATWPKMRTAFKIVEKLGFTYKSCAFDWMKADVSTLNLFPGPVDADMKMGYWTRQNSEACLLATRGKPKRLDAGVRQGIIEPAREHSRKPDCVHERIERLVAGPYLELFARTRRKGWTQRGDELGRFK